MPLYRVAAERITTVWHQNLWLEPWEIHFTSISDAATQLRSLGALWAPVQSRNFRKAALIQEKLPRLPTKLRPFPFDLPSGPMGSWTLLDETTLWASPVTTSPFAAGVIPLAENKTEPPSSAYLKLQEALTLYGSHPEEGEVCLDAGSSPGGWSWVLARTGATVHSVDRSPLDPRLGGIPNLHFRAGNAFSLGPKDLPDLDWFFSDVICYPAKLWEWLQPWLELGRVKHFVVTVKMQGKDCDWETLEKFSSVPGSRIVHLYHNKHELTWLL
ncbi:MAG: SAM-dependent methyltransferase [Spirochaetales bacterium]